MSASYDKVTGLPTFYKYVPTIVLDEGLTLEILDEYELPVEIMTIIGNFMLGGKCPGQEFKSKFLLAQLKLQPEDWYQEFFKSYLNQCCCHLDLDETIEIATNPDLDIDVTDFPDGVDMLFRNFDKNLKKHDTYRGNWHYWTPAWGQNEHEHAGIQFSQKQDKAIATMTYWREAKQEASATDYFGGLEEFDLIYGLEFGRQGEGTGHGGDLEKMPEIIHGDPIE